MSNQPDRGEFETEKSTFANRFHGEVTKSEFLQKDYGIVLVLTQFADIIEDPAGMSPTDVSCWYSIGGSKEDKGWQVSADGQEIIPSQPGMKIHARSKMGMLMDRVADELGALHLLGPSPSPRYARIWLGLKGDWERVPVAYKGLKREGEEGDLESSVVLPLSLEGASGAGVTTPAASGAALDDAELAALAKISVDKDLRGVRIAVTRDPVLGPNDDLVGKLLDAKDGPALLDGLVAKGLLKKDGDFYRKP